MIRALLLLILMALPVAAEPTAWIAREGKHVNLIFRTQDAATALPLVHLAESDEPFVMLSWGDADYYTTADKSVGLALRALLKPTQASINIRLMNSLADAPQTKATAKLYALDVADEHVEAMLAVVRDALVDDDGEVRLLLSDSSWVGGDFYAAHDRRYWLAYTCNNWVAKVLKAGELPFSTLGSQLAPGLMAQHRVGWFTSKRYRQIAGLKSETVTRGDSP
ncbi:MAG: DUF2459 domain-containing protein [Pseudomonadaceae bacterium]|nr:DUF2459 domain-containing protein [Pseudomonadaceae bacterium]